MHLENCNSHLRAEKRKTPRRIGVLSLLSRGILDFLNVGCGRTLRGVLDFESDSVTFSEVVEINVHKIVDVEEKVFPAVFR